jgi:hypothetical protein
MRHPERTYKMSEELVVSQLITEFKIREEKKKNQIFVLDVAEITASTLDENACTNTAIHMGPEKGLNDKYISFLEEIMQRPKTPIRTFK